MANKALRKSVHYLENQQGLQQASNRKYISQYINIVLALVFGKPAIFTRDLLAVFGVLLHRSFGKSKAGYNIKYDSTLCR